MRHELFREGRIQKIILPAHAKEIGAFVRHIGIRLIEGLLRLPVEEIKGAAESDAASALFARPPKPGRKKHVVALLLLLIKDIGIPPVIGLIDRLIRAEQEVPVLLPVDQIPAHGMHDILHRTPVSEIFGIVIILRRIKNMESSFPVGKDRAGVAGVVGILIFPDRKHGSAVLDLDPVLRNQKIPARAVAILILRISLSLIVEIENIEFSIVRKRDRISDPAIFRSVKDFLHERYSFFPYTVILASFPLP